MNSQEPVTHEQEVQNAVSALGKAMSTFAIYGTAHPSSSKTVEAAYNQFSELFVTHEGLDLGVVGGRFVVDGHPFTSTNSLMKGVEKKIMALGIVNLRLRPGLAMEEFKKLIELLHQADEKKLLQAISADELSNVESEDDLEYKLVHKGNSESESSDPTVDSAAPKEEKSAPAENSPPSINVEQIVAFMKGGDGIDSDAVKDEVSKLASDPEKLGKLILESVVMRQAVQSLENTESLSDVVMGCLRKTFDGLKSIEAFGKRGGRASMKKALLLLEKNVMDRIHSAIGKTDAKQDKQIIKAIKNMKMDLDIEQTVARYSEQAEALERTKKKLAGYVGSRGIKEVKQVGNANEIRKDDWRKIEVQGNSGRGSGSGKAGAKSLTEDLGSLAAVLEKLDELMQQEDHRKNLDEILGKAEQGLVDQSARTKEKISTLKRKISKKDASESTVESRASEMTVPELLAAIAEIVQELAQPLTAMDVSLEMVLKGFAGEVPDEQQSLLNLASSSGEHMGHLLDQLKDIVGLPKNLGIDHRFHPN